MGVAGVWVADVAAVTVPALVVGAAVWVLTPRRRLTRHARHDDTPAQQRVEMFADGPRSPWAGVPRQRERGASAVEYGLMIAAVTVVIMGTVFAFGQVLKTDFEDTGSHLQACLTDPAASECTRPTPGDTGGAGDGTRDGGGHGSGDSADPAP
jgi:Flp pilus assembly pilin Flp